MTKLIASLVLALAFTILTACGDSGCQIVAKIDPPNASTTAGNKVQFSLQSGASEGCPLAANVVDASGAWSTSDPINTTIDSNGLAACVNSTASPVSINYSGNVRGKAYSSAMLSCSDAQGTK